MDLVTLRLLILTVNHFCMGCDVTNTLSLLIRSRLRSLLFNRLSKFLYYVVVVVVVLIHMATIEELYQHLMLSLEYIVITVYID